MSEKTSDKKFGVLCQIVRAQHFAWRQAVAEHCPDVDPTKVVERMWAITGAGTAAANLKRLNRSAPLAPQIAESIAWVSQAMGENAVAEPGDNEQEGVVRHHECPWKQWHERQNLLDEDLSGCDAWFQATVDGINAQLGTKLRFETLKALPKGDACCLRRFWIDD